MVMDPAGPAERSFLLNACGAVLNQRLPEAASLVVVEDAVTLVEKGLLDADSVPEAGVYSLNDSAVSGA